jgi:acyl-homoserine-lactone acylase
LGAAEKYPDSTVTSAISVLRRWDRKTDSQSRGAVLFSHWFDKLNADGFARAWDSLSPIATPCGLKEPRKAVELLAKAAKEVVENYGSLDVSWGDVYRFRLGKFDYPANGGSEKYGIFRTFYYSKDADKKYRVVAGDSYVAVTQFGKKVSARVLLSYGNASQTGSKHVGDQLLLLSRKMLRPALLERNDILKNLEMREKI